MLLNGSLNKYSETQANVSEFKFLVQDCLILHSHDQVAKWSEQASVTSKIVGSIPTSNSWQLCEELVNALPTAVGSVWVLQLRDIDRVVRIVNCKISVINGTEWLGS